MIEEIIPDVIAYQLCANCAKNFLLNEASLSIVAEDRSKICFCSTDCFKQFWDGSERKQLPEADRTDA